jgi:hypothetical protein
LVVVGKLRNRFHGADDATAPLLFEIETLA